jgi:hypothetical protein
VPEPPQAAAEPSPERLEAAATAIQAAWRGARARQQWRKVRAALVRLQAAARQLQARRLAARLRMERAALAVQAAWRGKVARQGFARARAAAVQLQAAWRGRVARWQVQQQAGQGASRREPPPPPAAGPEVPAACAGVDLHGSCATAVDLAPSQLEPPADDMSLRGSCPAAAVTGDERISCQHNIVTCGECSDGASSSGDAAYASDASSSGDDEASSCEAEAGDSSALSAHLPCAAGADLAAPAQKGPLHGVWGLHELEVGHVAKIRHMWLQRERGQVA